MQFLREIERKFLCRVYVGGTWARHLDFVHKFIVTVFLHSYKIAGHFRDLAGCGISDKKNVTVSPKAGWLTGL